MKKSLRRRISFAFLLLIAATLVVIGIFHWMFIDDVYLRNKADILVKSYEKVNAYSKDLSDDRKLEDVAAYCAENGFTYVIADQNLNMIGSNTMDSNDMITLFFGTLLEMDENRSTELYSTEDYQIIRITDPKAGIEFLELWGVLDNGLYYVVRFPLSNIEEAAALSLKFYILTGAVMLVISAIVITAITKRLTKPLVELKQLSGRMAQLDFDARYTSGGEDEVGSLGENLNTLSAKLESTISELKSVNARLEKDIEEKERMEEKRRAFLSDVSHELKTPIALISGYAEGLKEMVLDTENREFYCSVIMDEAEKMNRLVRQLLSLDQLESGQDQLDITRFDISELIRGVVNASKIMIEQKGATVINSVPSPFYVWGDEFKIEQVVTNYLSNALNHLSGEKIIDIKCTCENDTASFSVFNTGDNIPEEELDNIWSKFYKIDKARTRQYSGSGIGLSIVKAIMELHRQKCYAVNYENGVAFFFTLPTK